MWDLGTEWLVAGAGDFNGDGLADVLFRNQDGTIMDWLSTGAGFTTNEVNSTTAMALNWHVAGIGDFNGDGRSDILWRSDTGQLTDWLGQPNGGFVSNLANANFNPGSGWQVAGVGDFNGNGRDDILVRNGNGDVKDWLGQSNGGFVANGASKNFANTWHISGVGDFNGDGRDDIFWRNDNLAYTEWNGTSTGAFVSSTANFPGGWDSYWQPAVGDFNGDHHDDVLWSAYGTVSPQLSQTNGGFPQFGDPNTSRDDMANWNFAAVGDFDGDGRDDTLWRNTDGKLDIYYGTANGGIESAGERLWAGALANVQEFFDAITSQVGDYSSGADQNSYYDDGSDHAPLDPGFLQMWGWLPTVQQDPAAHFWDYLTQDVDPEFQLVSLEGVGFRAAFDGSIASMTQVADLGDTYLFNMNDVLMRGVWHPFETSQDPPPPGAIVISGTNVGYWTFDAIGLGTNGLPDLSSPQQPPQSGEHPAATIVAPTYDTMNSAVAALHAQVDSSQDRDTKEHAAIIYRDATGYHLSKVFTGTAYGVDPQVLYNWLEANGVAFSQVVGYYHNHDFTGYGHDPVEQAINRYPSLERNGGHDWQVADYFVTHGADASLFILSLEDTDNVVRDFSYSMKATYENLTNDQMEQQNGYLLPPVVPIH